MRLLPLRAAARSAARTSIRTAARTSALALTFGALALASAPPAAAQLSGIRTICETGCNYATFADAVAALRQNLIGAGGVTFRVSPGTYTEQITLPSIGTTSTSRVVFESSTGNAADVVIGFAPDAPTTTYEARYNYVVSLNGADFVTFRNLTIRNTNLPTSPYGHVVLLTGGADDVTFEGTILRGIRQTQNGLTDRHEIVYEPTYAGAGNNVQNRIRFTGNRFLDGSFGILFDALTPVSGTPDPLAVGIVIDGNTFENPYAGGIQIRALSGAVVTGNTITTTPSAPNTVQGMRVHTNRGALRIEGNRIRLAAGGTGIAMFSTQGTASTPMLIANNMIHAAPSAVTGARGIASTFQNYHLNIVHNTIVLESDSARFSEPRGIEFSSDNNIALRNNIVVVPKGYAMHGSPLAQSGQTVDVTSDYNVFVGSSRTLIQYNFGPYPTLAAWQASNPARDPNSTSRTVAFANLAGGDLHLGASEHGQQDLRGVFFAGVTTDIDGQVRSSTAPYRGADEGPIALPADSPEVPHEATPSASVAPNPARGLATATFVAARSGAAEADVIDVLGRRVALLPLAAPLVAGETTRLPLDVSAFAPGVYVLRVRGEGAATAAAFVVAR